MRPISADEDQLRRILSPFHDASPFHYWAILELLDVGVLDLYKDKCTVEDPSSEWVDTHYRSSSISSREGKGHIEKKIKAAKFMSRRGHDIPKKPLKDSSENEPLFRFSGFEKSHHTPFKADVSCDEGCSNPAIAEVGYTKPERLLDAYGFTTAGEPTENRSGCPHVNRSVRHRQRSVKQFFVFPYTAGTQLDTDAVYCFEPRNLPEPDMGYIARMTSNAFEQHDSN